VQGNIDYFGKDRLTYLLYDCGGTSPDTVRASEERLATYDMRGFDVVRTDFDRAGIELSEMFGHFGYGAMVIDANGNLRGANLHGDQVFMLLRQLLEPNATGDEDDAPTFRVRTRLTVTQKPRVGFDISRNLPRPMLATVLVELQLPDGYHVYGTADTNPTPTVLTVGYSRGMQVGKPELQDAVEVGAGVQHAKGPVRFRVPIELPKGTPIGQYVIHGTLRFMACDAEKCLPPTEVKWHAVVPAL
jgi:hypothetical protein